LSFLSIYQGKEMLKHYAVHKNSFSAAQTAAGVMYEFNINKKC